MASVMAARKSRSKGVVAVTVIGIIVFVVGAYKVGANGALFRGSGLGTVLLVVENRAASGGRVDIHPVTQSSNTKLVPLSHNMNI